MVKVVYFFGYGLYRNSQMLKEVLLKNPLGGYGAIAQNYDLAIQNLNQVSGIAKEILEKVWGKSFRAYTLKPGNGIVKGVIWELEEDDIKKLYEWNYINDWRVFEIIKVKKYNGEIIEAITEKVPDDAPITEIVDGINYIDNLNSNRFQQKEKINLKEDYDYRTKEIAKIMSELKNMNK